MHRLLAECTRFTDAVDEIQVHFLTSKAAILTVHLVKQLLDMLYRGA